MNATHPKITIITPSYNQGEFIEATILSVLNQTYPNIEYIIMDGGSTDETMDVIAHYRDRIDMVVHEHDKGQSDAINKGFRLATGELVGWLNSDDTLYPDCVTQLVDYYWQHPDGAVYYSSALNWIDEQGQRIATHFRPIPNRNYLLNHNYDVIQPGSFYPSHLVQRIGYLNEGVHYCMDLDLWLQLLQHGPVYAYTDRPVAGFRIWGNSKTTTGGHHFLSEIIGVLRHNGAPTYARSVLKAQYQQMRKQMKSKLVR